MKSEVNNVFDGIVASVEAQRSEALQNMSQGVEEMWSQKETMEVSLAQLDSFTRFADQVCKCTTNTRYVAIAAQGVMLMERLKNVHGNEAAFEPKKMILATSKKVNKLFALGEPKIFRFGLTFSPITGSKISNRSLGCKVKVKVSLSATAEGVCFEEVFYPSLHQSCKFDVSALYDGTPVSTEVEVGQSSSWMISIPVCAMGYRPLTIHCKLSGAVNHESDVEYTA